uniref:F-box associated domain-containing protein n=1 Tax=Setaria italica TaxID=4555 RepID=A0A0Q3QQV0_SETIT
VVPEKPPPPDRRKVDEERRALLREQEKDAEFCLDWFFSLPDGAVTANNDNVEETHQAHQIQQLPSVEEPDDDPCRLMEWPPVPWTLQVFSSRTGRNEPAGIVQDMRLDPPSKSLFHGHANGTVYLQGALYVHCRGSFVARISFTDDKYRVIKAPANIEYAKPYVGRLENRVCFGITHECQLRVWTLNESYGKMEWVMKCQDDLMHCAKHVGENSREMHGAWIVKEEDTVPKESSEWDSDNDDIFEVIVDAEYMNQFDILGFHPYKEAVFLVGHFGVVAYHLDTSKGSVSRQRTTTILLYI